MGRFCPQTRSNYSRQAQFFACFNVLSGLDGSVLRLGCTTLVRDLLEPFCQALDCVAHIVGTVLRCTGCSLAMLEPDKLLAAAFDDLLWRLQRAILLVAECLEFLIINQLVTLQLRTRITH